MLLSVVFIIVTLIIFGCIPKLQSLNGKCLICYLATLALGYTFLSGAQLNGTTLNQPLLCDSVGYLVYFTLLSAFLWLSVINFDLWLSFQWVSQSESERNYEDVMKILYIYSDSRASSSNWVSKCSFSGTQLTAVVFHVCWHSLLS